MSRSACRKSRAHAKVAMVPSNVNLLLGKTFTSSTGSAGGSPLSCINDGNDTTRWISDPIDNVIVTADMGAAYRLSRLRLVLPGDCTKNYRVELSADNATWVSIHTGATANNPNIPKEDTSITITSSMSGRFFRIVCIDRWVSTYGNSIWEAEAYGYTSGSTPPPTDNTPVNLTYSNVTSSSVQLNWGAPPNPGGSVQGYYLYQNGTKTNTTITTSTFATVSSLSASTNYTFTVRSVVGGTESAPSNAVSVTTSSVVVQPSGTIFSTDPANPTRIMPVGDSITVGFAGSDMSQLGLSPCIGGAGYRQRLWLDIKNSTNWQTVSVGRCSDLEPIVGKTVIVGSYVDNNHVRHSGFGGWDTIDMRISGQNCPNQPYDSDATYYNPAFGNITNWMTDYKPHVILFEGGTNDINKSVGPTAPEALANISALLSVMFQLDPNVIVFVSTIPLIPDEAYTPWNPNDIRIGQSAKLNEGLPNLVQQFKNAGRRIYFADIFHNFVRATDMENNGGGIHPSEAGYAKMAVNWKSVLTAAQNGTL